MAIFLNFVFKTALIWLVLGGFFCVFSQSETIRNLHSCYKFCTRVTEELHSFLSQSELSNFFLYSISLGIYSLCKEFTSTFSNTFPPRQKYNDPSLTWKFQSSRFLKANFLVAGFYCIHMLKVRSDVSIQRRGWVPLLFHLWAFDNPPSPWYEWCDPPRPLPLFPLSIHPPACHLSIYLEISQMTKFGNYKKGRVN